MGVRSLSAQVAILARLLFLITLAALHPASAQTHPDADFTRLFQRTNGWTAGDGAISIPLSDGRIIWLFGDSHLDDIDPVSGSMPCLFQCRNAAFVISTNEFRTARTLAGKGPGFRSWLKKNKSDDDWFWPLCGFQEGKTVYIYLSSLEKTGAGGMWGWRSTGQDYWAKIGLPDLDQVAYSTLPSFNGITFGVGFVKDGTYIYAFGGKQSGLASDLYVARFVASNPESRWTFWSGREWLKSATNATPVARGNSTSLHVCRVQGKYLLTTSAFSLGCDQGKEIFCASSERPTGPFTKLKAVYSISDRYEGHSPFFYFPTAHPEFVNAQNEILVTYSINGFEPCVSACTNGRAIPDHYRPKAIRVKLDGL